MSLGSPGAGVGGAGSCLRDLISSHLDSDTSPCYPWVLGLGSSDPPLRAGPQTSPRELRTEVWIHVGAWELNTVKKEVGCTGRT